MTAAQQGLVDQLLAQQEELRTQNEQLHEAHTLLQRILAEYTDLYDHAPVAFVTLDPQGLIARMNDATERLLAVRRDRLVGMPFHSFVRGEFQALLREHIRRCRAGEPLVSTGLTLTRTDGHAVPVELVGSPAVSGDGFFTAIIDLTERKRADARAADLAQALERRTTEAEQYASRLRALAAKLTEAESAERRRLARNLHDHLQQELVAAKYCVALAKREEDPEKLYDVERVLDRCLEMSRQITADLTPPPLQQGAGLPAALRWLAERSRERHGLAVDVTVADNAEPATDPVRILLYEVTRELLLNVVKHADVKEAAVSLSRAEAKRLRLIVSDEGAGFQMAELLDRADFVTGLGLFGLRERVESLGGTVDVRSAPGHGTRVTIEVPDLPPAETPPQREVDSLPR
jgi:PAS domain S-box-containing protein